MQRLGYLLEHVDAGETATALKSHVGSLACQTAALLPGASQETAHRDPEWKLIVNAEVKADL